MLSEEIRKEYVKISNPEYDFSFNDFIEQFLSKVEQLEQQNKELIAVLIFACLECGYEYGRPYCNNCFYFKKIGKLEKLLQKKWEDIINEH